MPSPEIYDLDAPDFEFWKVPFIASKIRKTRQFVYDEIHSGRLAAQRIGRDWYVRPEDFRSYVETLNSK